MANKGTAAIGFIFITLMIDITGLGLIIPVMPSLIEELTGEGISRASEYGGWLVFTPLCWVDSAISMVGVPSFSSPSRLVPSQISAVSNY